MEATDKGLVLIMESGPTMGKIYPIEERLITLGREGDNTIVLPNPKISRYHARLQRLPTGTVLLEDLNSTNGTFIEGEAVTEPSQLFPGEAFTLADQARFRLIATRESSPAAHPPSKAPGPSLPTRVPGKAQMPQNPEREPAKPAQQTALPTRQPQKREIHPENSPWLYAVVGCLALLTCLCLGVAIYLWFAPPSFLEWLLSLLGFQLP